MNNTNIIYEINSIIYNIKKNPQKIENIYILKINKRTNTIINILNQKNIKYTVINNSTSPTFRFIKIKYDIICKLKIKHYKEKFTIITLIKKIKNPLFLILDRIQDPNNLGACIRSAEAANVTGIIITKNNSAKITPLVNKISCGCSSTMPIIIIKNIIRIIKILHSYNINTICMSSNANNPIYKNDLTKPIAIIIGSEINGIKPIIKKSCHANCNIPMLGICNSLNISVATGITLFEIQRQRYNYKYN